MHIYVHDLLQLTMAKGVVSGGAIPGRHGEHEVGSGAEVGHTAILRIVNDESDEVGTVLLSESVGLVHDPIGAASQLTQGISKSIGGGFGVRSEGRVDQIDPSGDAGCFIRIVGFREGEGLGFGNTCKQKTVN